LLKLESSISEQEEQLKTIEADYRSMASRRRELRQRMEEGRDRRSEIFSMINRFALLDKHYVSDISRLKGIEEGGNSV
jgi:uncharacterized coiled-coil DUF342 family protein